MIHLRCFSTKKPPGFWKDPFNQKDFLLSISKALNIQKYSDWYNISHRDITRHGGYGLLTYISHAEAIMRSFPEHDWQIWKFTRVPPNFWENKSNHRLFFDQLAKSLNISKLDDWYRINLENVIENGGSGLLANYYNNSLIKALITIFPEHNWKRWKFQRVPQEEWRGNLLHEFLEDLGKKLGVKSSSDWYHVTSAQVKEHGGSSLLTAFGDSMYKILSTAFPNEKWVLWRVETLPDRYWDNKNTIAEAMKWVEGHFNIRNMEDWYSVTSTQLEQVGLTSLIQKFGGIHSLLQKYYSTYPWDFSKNIRFKVQNIMVICISELFPQAMDIYVNHSENSLRYSETNKKMQFDVFIPSLSLAFEYQGIQHYDTHFLAPGNKQKIRDEEKRKACEGAGITLVEIPFWWDQQKESLQATIHQKRPDLIPTKGIGNPIPEFPIKLKSIGTKNVKEISDSYWLAVGSKTGNFPKCRNCSHEFTDRNQIRVVVGATFKHSGNSQRGYVSLCAKTKCLQSTTSPSSKITAEYSNFEGKIYFPEELENRLGEVNSDLPGVHLLKLTR